MTELHDGTADDWRELDAYAKRGLRALWHCGEVLCRIRDKNRGSFVAGLKERGISTSTGYNWIRLHGNYELDELERWPSMRKALEALAPGVSNALENTEPVIVRLPVSEPAVEPESRSVTVRYPDPPTEPQEPRIVRVSTQTADNFAERQSEPLPANLDVLVAEVVAIDTLSTEERQRALHALRGMVEAWNEANADAKVRLRPPGSL